MSRLRISQREEVEKRYYMLYDKLKDQYDYIREPVQTDGRDKCPSNIHVSLRIYYSNDIGRLVMFFSEYII